MIRSPSIQPRRRWRVAAVVVSVGVTLTGASIGLAGPPETAKPNGATAPGKKKPRTRGREPSAKATRPAAGEAASAAPLTAEALGLGGISLRSIKEGSEPVSSTPSPAPPRPATSASSRATAPLATAPPATAPPATSKPAAAPLSDAKAWVATAPPRAADKADAPPGDGRRRFTFALNPLPIVAGRYGLDVELVPAPHHALVGSAWLQTFPSPMLRLVVPKEVDVSHGVPARVGGEIGYRLYSGRDGAEGLFAGASGVLLPLAMPRAAADLHSEIVAFDAYGAAVDVGAQAITRPGFTIGGGLGAMYIVYDPPKSAPLPPGAPKVGLTIPHVLPRLLLSTGWSF